MDMEKTDTNFKVDWQVGDTPLKGEPLCCAIGNFDGVHKGHQHIISHAVQTARDLNMKSAVVSFSPHPRSYFRKEDAAFLLMDETQKKAQIRALGVDYMIVIHFNAALQQMSAQEFVQSVLVDALHISKLFAGSDFAFGKGREGSMAALAEQRDNIALEAVPVTLLNDSQNMAISSSRIRAALQAGQLDLAAQMLGRAHILSGEVIMGDQRGRQLDFPTANFSMENLLHPAFGVYAVRAWLDDDKDSHAQPIYGVCNIGRRPTVNDRGVLAETHLFDFDRDIYGHRLSIELLDFIRPEQKFSSLEALRHQIAADCKVARTVQDQIDASHKAS